MTELKPCPFCGSGWLYETMRNGYCDETPTMFCNSCKAVVTWEQVEDEGVNDETRAFVREHWNTRAERTCENVGYYIDGTRFKCSNCGYNGWTNWAKDGHDRVPNYCPNCGARVTKSDQNS